MAAGGRGVQGTGGEARARVLTGNRKRAFKLPAAAVIRSSFAGCSHGADLIYSSWELRGLMITLALNRIALPLAAMLALGSMAVAQQTNAPNPATAPAKPKPAQPAAMPGASKRAPEAAAAAGAQPSLLGQYGEWGAYPAHTGAT